MRAGLFNFEWFAFEMPTLGSIEATRMNSASPGITIESCAEGGHDLGSFSNGSYVAYNDINMTGLTSFTARMASAAAAGGELQVRLDSPVGPLIGSCQVPNYRRLAKLDEPQLQSHPLRRFS
jgi:hypothetical protein